jgi:hypothetical protein
MFKEQTHDGCRALAHYRYHAPEFTWLVLNALAALMLILVFVLGRRSRSAIVKRTLF